MERRWFNSKKELECRCGLNKSMDSLGPSENTGEIEDPNRKDTTQNIQSCGSGDDSNYNTVDFLSILKTITTDPDFYSNVENVEFLSILKTVKIGDPDFLNLFISSLLDIRPFWKDRNGDVYRIHVNRENETLELEATRLDELPNFYRYLCFRDESTNEDTSSNNNAQNNLNNINYFINSYIDNFIQSEINIVTPMEINIDKLSASYIYRCICGESPNNDIEDIGDIEDIFNDIEDIGDIEDIFNDIEDIGDIEDVFIDIQDIRDIEDSFKDIQDIRDIEDSFNDREAFWEGEDSSNDIEDISDIEDNREAFGEGEDSSNDIEDISDIEDNREAFWEGEDSSNDIEDISDIGDSFNDREVFWERENSSNFIYNISTKILNNNSEKYFANIQTTNKRFKNEHNCNFQESTLNDTENRFSNNRETNAPNPKMGVQNDFNLHIQEDAFNERENTFSKNIQNISKDISVHDTFDFNDFNEDDAVATNTEHSFDNNRQDNCIAMEARDNDNDIETETNFKGWEKEAIYAHVAARVKAICEDMDNLSKTFHNVGGSSCTNDGERRKDMVKATEAQDEDGCNDRGAQGSFKDEKIGSEESCKGRERDDTSNDREALSNDGEDRTNDGGHSPNVGEGSSNDGEGNCNDSDETDKFSKFKHLWVLCDNCYTLNYKRLLRSRMSICEHCEWHLKMNSSDRLDLSIDPDTWDPMDEDMVSLDPIEFEGDSEEESYKDRLDSYQTTTGLPEAVQTGIGELNGIPVAVGVMDFEFIGGSMASVVGEKITRLIEYATNQFLPLIIVCASGGARMQEGSVSLMQMAKISSVLYDYQSNKKLFYISILASPTTGGVTASFGMLGDIIIAEPNAYIAFAGKRVIEETLKITVPEGVQETEYLFDKGSFDLIVPRKFLKSVLTELLNLHAFFPLIQNENKNQIEG